MLQNFIDIFQNLTVTYDPKRVLIMIQKMFSLYHVYKAELDDTRTRARIY